MLFLIALRVTVSSPFIFHAFVSECSRFARHHCCFYGFQQLTSACCFGDWSSIVIIDADATVCYCFGSVRADLLIVLYILWSARVLRFCLTLFHSGLLGCMVPLGLGSEGVAASWQCLLRLRFWSILPHLGFLGCIVPLGLYSEGGKFVAIRIQPLFLFISILPSLFMQSMD